MTDEILTDPALSDRAMTGDRAMADEELRRHLEGCLDEAVDPAATLAAVPDAELARLADGLYRHLDTPSPAFGARFWYVQVTEELRRRRLRPSRPGAAPVDPVASEAPAG
ncbi:hypothetical protein [Arthrobacter globiformis]|uniref:hypothetical protein n=1 Tax=Arthrobacter globiformis TaxID=1665 RepID=UPI0027868A4E|nr:hypothetical protein [Arthrobacter globiformis]MDQ0863122.1 hypothetical protein [Arthrobacter globiformis]